MNPTTDTDTDTDVFSRHASNRARRVCDTVRSH